MNKRIRELKDQSRDFYLNCEDLNLTSHELHRAVEEKFVELIIKDVIGVWNSIENGNDVHGTDYFPEAVYRCYLGDL